MITSASTLTTVPDGTIHVVAAVLTHGGKVLVAQRVTGSHLEGMWEFPGGKVHDGEAAVAALRRELREEIGIDVVVADPVMRIPYAYPDKSIVLDVWRVESWRGTPHGREGQPVRWADVAALRPSEFPPADRPVLRWLQLPRLYLISNAFVIGVAAFMERLESVLAAGVRLIQLREPAMTAADFQALAQEVVPVCRRYGARVLINGDSALARGCGADGVHLNGARLHALSERPLDPDMLVAASCHSIDDLEQAAAIGADFAVLSPVAPTPSHPDASPLGWERFANLVAGVTLPVYALGGMRVEDIKAAVAAGAQGVAMMRGVWDAADPAAVVQLILGQGVAAASSR